MFVEPTIHVLFWSRIFWKKREIWKSKAKDISKTLETKNTAKSNESPKNKCRWPRVLSHDVIGCFILAPNCPRAVPVSTKNNRWKWAAQSSALCSLRGPRRHGRRCSFLYKVPPSWSCYEACTASIISKSGGTLNVNLFVYQSTAGLCAAAVAMGACPQFPAKRSVVEICCWMMRRRRRCIYRSFLLNCLFD